MREIQQSIEMHCKFKITQHTYCKSVKDGTLYEKEH